MIFSYYPGCTLKTKAKSLDIYGKKSAEELGIFLEELPDWQCCGAVYPMAGDEIATRLSSVRALATARNLNRGLVTLCSACHNVLKRVNEDMKTNEYIRTRVNNYLEDDIQYNGETEVYHYLEMIRNVIGFENLKRKIKYPLKGKKIASYYGCLLLRPGKVMQFDNPENPSIMEDFIRAIGAEPVIYPFRNECCGGYITLENRRLAKEKCNTIVASAIEKGAEAIITACPLCMYNLEVNSTELKLPVYYFTELLAEALGVK
ncbi:MAG TPA: disulfide reductase [Clostridiaceae bacterium]|nr:disulfide reductase [Clostridiaceae bacterium]